MIRFTCRGSMSLLLVLTLLPALSHAAGSPKGDRFLIEQTAPDHWRLFYDSKGEPAVQWEEHALLLALPLEGEPDIRLMEFTGLIAERDSPLRRVSGDASDFESLGIRLDDILRLHRSNFRGIDIGKLTVVPLISLEELEGLEDPRFHLETAEFDFHIDLSGLEKQREPRPVMVDFLRSLVFNDASLEPLVAAASLPSPTAPLFAPATADFARTHGPVLKFRVHGEGLKRVTGAALADAGVNLAGVRPGGVQLWIGKERAPLFVHVSGNAFTTEDALLFWVREPLAEMETFRTCWLTFSPQEFPDGPEFQVQPAAAPSSATAPTERDWVYDDEVHEEERLFVSRYEDNSVPQSSWFWSQNDTYRQFLSVSCPSMVEGATGSLEVEYFVNKRNPPQGNVRLLTSPRVPEATAPMEPGQFGALQSWFAAADLEEDARLHFQLVSYPRDAPRGSAVYVDTARVRYPRRLEPEVAPLDFRLPPGETVRLRVRRTNNTPVELWSRRADGSLHRHTATDGGEDLVTFVARPRPEEEFLLTSLKHMPPLPVEADRPSRLSDMDEVVDTVILAHRDLMTEDLERLAEHRRAEGLSVVVLDAAQVYDEWNGGEKSSEAIRRFLRHTISEWPGGGPLHALLVGEANWDFYDRKGTGVPNHLPTWFDQADGKMGNALEDRLACFEYAGFLPQMVLGRMSPRSAGELKAMVDKTIAAETDPAWGPWRARSLVVADQDPHSDEFWRHSRELMSDFPPDQFAGWFFDFDRYPFENHNAILAKVPHLKIRTSPEGTSAFIDRINQGAGMLQYLGHGGVPVWSKARLLLGLDRPDSDIRLLENTGRYPFVISWSCLCGRFYLNEPTYDVCIAEEWQRHPDKGSVAMLAPTGSGSSTQHRNLGGWIADRLYWQDVERLGEAVMSAKLAFHIHQSHYLPEQMTYFGDPLARFARPRERLEVEITPASGPAEPAQLSLVVNADTVQNGTVTVEFTDMTGAHVHIAGSWPLRSGRSAFRVPITPETTAADQLLVYAWDPDQGADAAAVLDLDPEVRLQLRPALAPVDGVVVEAEIQTDDRAFTVRDLRLELTGPGGLQVERAPGSERSFAVALPLTGGEPRLVRGEARLTWRDLLNRQHEVQQAFFVPHGEGIAEATGPLVALSPATDDGGLLPASGSKLPQYARLAAWWDPADRTTEACQARVQEASSGEESARVHLLLEPGEPLTLSSPFLLSALPPGEHSLRVRIEPRPATGGEVAPLLETTLPYEVRGDLDLALESPRLVSQPGPYGRTVQVVARVANRGSVSLQDVRFEAYDGPTDAREKQLELWPVKLADPESLEPGESRPLRFHIHAYGPLESGQVRVVAVPHPRTMTDSQPGNNEILLNVDATPDPDLRLSGLEVTVNREFYEPGEQIPVQVTVVNSGEGPAPVALLHLATRGLAWGAPLEVRDLAPGESRTLSTSLPVRHGNHLLTATVDPWNAVRETEEANNTARLSVAAQIVLTAAESGWRRNASGWEFAPEEAAWNIFDRLHIEPSARGEMHYLPPVPFHAGHWDEALLNPEDARTDSAEATEAGTGYVRDLQVGFPEGVDISPLRFRIEADEGIYQPELTAERFSPFSREKRSALRYRYSPDAPWTEATFGSKTYRTEPVRLDTVEVTDGFLTLEMDDVGDPVWQAHFTSQPVLVTTGGRLTSPIVDFGNPVSLYPRSRLEAPDGAQTARIEWRGAATPEALQNAPWRSGEDTAITGRILQWRLLVEGEVRGSVWLENLALREVSPPRAESR